MAKSAKPCLMVMKGREPMMGREGGPGFSWWKFSLFWKSDFNHDKMIILHRRKFLHCPTRQHCRFSICSYFGWLWQIQNLRRAGLSKLDLKLAMFKRKSSWALHLFNKYWEFNPNVGYCETRIWVYEENQKQLTLHIWHTSPKIHSWCVPVSLL